ncbi:PetM family of cytochrome b6f complex subunit 7 [Methylobacterium nonmethylotrophicum]|uniref:PetM family of cytochrome b6f complex subunit 7 n=1 Tax=Methylobacterium nonmethylotrophicum TaxID=1141884 RepID=A0A4Z0NU62_9HYPH|nr:PetM family of cytochrome b6f complex subunit 7 [Methylobacterium nonmethylotrophicum]TGE00319.1 PetM family of cytochrome b6f complex subunit 7 [Methylobacterium nonmethylotrophicum]
MIRFLCRSLGLLLLAAGFVGIVYDGARSIANNAVLVTSVSDVAVALLKDRAASLQAMAEGGQPTLWKLLGLPFTLSPAAPIALVLGLLLLWLGQPPRVDIGTSFRP